MNGEVDSQYYTKLLQLTLQEIVEKESVKLVEYGASSSEIGVVVFKDLTSLKNMLTNVALLSSIESTKILITRDLVKKVVTNMQNTRKHEVKGDAVEATPVNTTPAIPTPEKEKPENKPENKE